MVAFMRSRAADFIYCSKSFDYGDTWSEAAPTVLPNNNSSISAIRLQSGRIAIAYYVFQSIWYRIIEYKSTLNLQVGLYVARLFGWRTYEK